ncbi:MAG: hypothetical protein ACM3YM_07340 [Sphingomonadales bacterium]
MKRSWTIALLAAAAALGGCGNKDQSDGGVTPEESAGLNNAADMLDTAPDSLTAADQTPLGKGDEESADAASEAPAASNADNAR